MWCLKVILKRTPLVGKGTGASNFWGKLGEIFLVSTFYVSICSTLSRGSIYIVYGGKNLEGTPEWVSGISVLTRDI